MLSHYTKGSCNVRECLFIISGICKTRLRYHSNGHQVSVSFNLSVVVSQSALIHLHVWYVMWLFGLINNYQIKMLAQALFTGVDVRALTGYCGGCCDIFLHWIKWLYRNRKAGVIVILLRCSQPQSVLKLTPSCKTVKIQASRLYSIGHRLLRANHFAMAPQEIRHESSTSCLVASQHPAILVLVCELPPVCMVFSCMTAPALTCCSLCSLLTKEIIMSCQHFEGWR